MADQPEPTCKVCRGSGFIAHKQFIDDGYGEVDTCPACAPPPDPSPAASPSPLLGQEWVSKVTNDTSDEPSVLGAGRVAQCPRCDSRDPRKRRLVWLDPVEASVDECEPCSDDWHVQYSGIPIDVKAIR